MGPWSYMCGPPPVLVFSHSHSSTARRRSSMRRTTMFLTVLGLSLASLLVATSMAPAQNDTKGKVTLESKSVALGVGVSWGDGILEYRGKTYPFTVRGLSVVDLGVSKITAKDEVVNLKKLSDFDGNYASAKAGA